MVFMGAPQDKITIQVSCIINHLCGRRQCRPPTAACGNFGSRRLSGAFTGPGARRQISASFLSRRSSRSRAADERQTTRMVSSPPTVPRTSGHDSPSSADATGWAPPGTVRSTIISPTPSTRVRSCGRSASKAGRAALLSVPSATAYRTPSGVGTRANRSSRRSRESVDCVTSHPRLCSRTRSSSWLPTG